MELLLIFLGAFVVALSGALMPGPLLTVTITHSLQRGFRAGPLIVLGHMILELLLLVLIVMGFQKYLMEDPAISIIFFSGAAIMGYMGLSMIRSVLSQKITLRTEHGSFSIKRSPVLDGILVSLSNPYWLVWWLTVGLGYILKSLDYGIAGLTVFFSGHILADLTWYAAVSFSFSRGRKLLTGSAYRRFILLCGAFLIIFGIWFFISGLKS